MKQYFIEYTSPNKMFPIIIDKEFKNKERAEKNANELRKSVLTKMDRGKVRVVHIEI